MQPYDMEVGAGTFHPATTLRSLGARPWAAAYVQPSRRPTDGRYGENPNRLQHYYQYQVLIKPSPPELQALYLGSLEAIGIDMALHDIRFVVDVWESPALRESLTQLQRAARSDSSVLIIGETGTGKELAVRLLHARSDRAERVLVKWPCAALPEQLLESELFGHEKGSFTGAHKRKIGRFELADGGTLFLDEIGEMSPAMQAKLLRALQDGEVRAVGATRVRRVDVRIVAATNRDLQREVQEGSFRSDLFYRLDVVRIAVPPLREHTDAAFLGAVQQQEEALCALLRERLEVRILREALAELLAFVPTYSLTRA